MSAQEFVAARESIYLSNCCNFAVTALLVYEYLITLDREVALFWRRRVTGASVLFFTNRYLVLVVYLLLLMYLVPMSDHSCLLLARSSTVLGYLQIIPQAAFSAMRALALSGMNWYMAGAVFLLAVVPFGTNMVTFSFSSTVQYNPLLGECLAMSNTTRSQAIIFTAVSRGCLMASDAILIVLTWYRLARAGVANWGDFKLRGSSFSGILLKDGSAYFLTLLLVNLMHMISTLVALSPLARSADHISYVSAFTYMYAHRCTRRFPTTPRLTL
ncbi:hypothetical protein BD413DRAFT_574050 [Trametes elegans]|nr:hypothetical protein BD413DRAFT_574050 [Trametes elegans]